MMSAFETRTDFSSTANIMKCCLSFLLIAGFSFRNVGTIENASFVNETGHSSFENPQNKVGRMGADVHEFLVDTYFANAKGDGTLKRSSERSFPTVHGFIGQGTITNFLFCFHYQS